MRDGDDNINFQKASCTLDGCVKVYTSRVDAVATETNQLLLGLAENNSSGGKSQCAYSRQRVNSFLLLEKSQENDDGDIIEEEDLEQDGKSMKKKVCGLERSFGVPT